MSNSPRIRLLAPMLWLGWVSGMPLQLTGQTFQAWMKQEGLDLETIGLATLLGLPYVLKPLWAPLLDRLSPQGRRRWIWILGALSFTALGISLLAWCRPSIAPFRTAFLALGLATASATLDTALDAWRAENLEASWLGMGNSLHMSAYRLGMLAAGAGALVVADRWGFPFAYGLLALIVGVALLSLPMLPPEETVIPKKSSFLEPFKELLARTGAWELLSFALLYKLGDALAQAMAMPFLQELGFSLTAIGAMTKAVGLSASILGLMLGGSLMLRWSLRRSVLVFGFLQAVSTLAYVLLSMVGPRLWFLGLALGLENLCYGMGTAAFAALLMRHCHRSYTATQYALLIGLAALGRTLLAAPTGWVAKGLGWSTFFLLCTLLALPGLWFARRCSLRLESTSSSG